jgi:hypothetical protein
VGAYVRVHAAIVVECSVCYTIDMHHHAYVLYGSYEWAVKQLPFDIHAPSPDVSVLRFERMYIADIKELHALVLTRPVIEAQRSVVIVARDILIETQNALLKLIEEPRSHVRFYFIIQDPTYLLPTVTSRLHILGNEYNNMSDVLWTEFLKRTYGDRLAYIGECAKGDDQKWATDLLESFVAYARKTHDIRLQKVALYIAQYMHRVGASKKMLLEHIALL